MCDWRGSSSELVRIDDSEKFKDPRALLEFMHFLHQKIAPQIGAELVRLELVGKEHTSGNVAYLTNLLVGFSRAGFESVLKGVLGASPDGE